MLMCLVYCWFFFFTATRGFELNNLKAEIFNHRVKRDSGIIAFRPLFVYRAQQKEKQARWKLIEAQKLVQQQQLQNHQYSIDYHSTHPSNPTKSEYDYKLHPVQPNYQTMPWPYQNYPFYQLNQKYQDQPSNSYEVYPNSNSYPTLTYSSYSSDGSLYANQQDFYYDKYDSEYYS